MFDSLPDNVIQQIALSLDSPAEMENMRFVSKKVYRALHQPSFLRYLINIHCPLTDIPDNLNDNQLWEFYRQHHVPAKERKYLLIQATRNNNIAEFLLRFRTRTMSPNALFIEAIIAKADHIFNFLLTDPELDINRIDQHQKSPLMYACIMNEIDFVKALVKDKRLNLERDGNHAALLASHHGHDDIVSILINLPSLNIDYDALILAATRFGKDNIIKLLANNKNANFNLRDYFGRTPLIMASENNCLAIIDVLVKNKTVNPNAQDSLGETALLKAVRKNHRNAVSLLLYNIHLDVNVYCYGLYANAITAAVASNDIAMIQILLNDTRYLDLDKAFEALEENPDQIILGLLTSYKENVIKPVLFLRPIVQLHPAQKQSQTENRLSQKNMPRSLAICLDRFKKMSKPTEENIGIQKNLQDIVDFLQNENLGFNIYDELTKKIKALKNSSRVKNGSSEIYLNASMISTVVEDLERFVDKNTPKMSLDTIQSNVDFLIRIKSIPFQIKKIYQHYEQIYGEKSQPSIDLFFLERKARKIESLEYSPQYDVDLLNETEFMFKYIAIFDSIEDPSQMKSFFNFSFKYYTNEVEMIKNLEHWHDSQKVLSERKREMKNA